MITILSALTGFFSALLPDLISLFRDHQDRSHELAVLDRQLAQQREGFSQRLEEIHVQADIAESGAIYKTWRSHIRWVDALNGTVRPVLAYAFFLIYAGVKLLQFSLLPDAPFPWQVEELWGVEDQAVFAGIIAFYYGQRAMGKVRR